MNNDTTNTQDERVLLMTGAPVEYKTKAGKPGVIFPMSFNIDELIKLKGSGMSVIAQVCADGKLRINAQPTRQRTASKFTSVA